MVIWKASWVTSVGTGERCFLREKFSAGTSSTSLKRVNPACFSVSLDQRTDQSQYGKAYLSEYLQLWSQC